MIQIIVIVERYNGTTFEQLLNVNLVNIQQELTAYKKSLGKSYRICNWYRI